jgi:hypothetical protein
MPLFPGYLGTATSDGFPDAVAACGVHKCYGARGPQGAVAERSQEMGVNAMRRRRRGQDGRNRETIGQGRPFQVTDPRANATGAPSRATACGHEVTCPVGPSLASAGPGETGPRPGSPCCPRSTLGVSARWLAAIATGLVTSWAMPRWPADRVPYPCKEPLPARPLQFGSGGGLSAAAPHLWP